jgi:hypothetical protein
MSETNVGEHQHSLNVVVRQYLTNVVERPQLTGNLQSFSRRNDQTYSRIEYDLRVYSLGAFFVVSTF